VAKAFQVDAGIFLPDPADRRRGGLLKLQDSKNTEEKSED
jgi:hypothetical protein